VFAFFLKTTIGAICAALITVGTSTAGPIVTDASGREVAVYDASRIVSIGGGVTEILFALGVEDRVVAVDLTSNFPSRVAKKPSVGYMRGLSAEGVLALGPSVVIAVEGSGPREAIDVLDRASVPFVLVPQAHDAPGIAAAVRFVAKVVGEEESGEEIAGAVLADAAALEAIRAKISERRKAIFILSVSGGSPLVGGAGTAADDIFALAGIDNALAGMSGYKPASDEAAVAADPYAIILMAERSATVTDEEVLSTPAFAGTAAAENRRLYRLSGTYLLNFGPRAVHAARDLAALIYPELELPELPPRPWTTDPATTD
jgi:iron complex transport system substrate-binding protein